MATRREAVAGGIGTLAVLITGCSSILLRSEDSDEDDGGSDQNTEGLPDGESDGSGTDRDGSNAAAIDYEIEIDRWTRPRLGDSIDIEFTVSNGGKRSGVYDYRLRLEHEDGLLGGDERISGRLSGGSEEVFDLEFAPPRAGTVAVLVDDEVVDEFTVRSRRDGEDGGNDGDGDEDDEDDGDGDNADSVATGGGGTIVGKAATGN